MVVTNQYFIVDFDGFNIRRYDECGYVVCETLYEAEALIHLLLDIEREMIGQ